ncbi:MAG: transcription elongation factor Spt5 [Methanomassiliicoccales archaeon]|jgi:transcriptional antiterminator NusG
MSEEVNPPAVPAEPAEAPVPQQLPETTTTAALAFAGEKDDRKVAAGEPSYWNISLKSDQPGKHKASIKITISLTGGEGAAEWEARIHDANERIIWDSASISQGVDINLDGGKPKELKFELQAPKGVRYAEGAKATLEACMTDAPSVCDRMEFSAVARQSVVALKASIGHERQVADDVASKAKVAKSGIYAILAPTTLRGYVLIEGMNTDELKETVRGIRRARGLVEGETSFAEIDHFLTPKPLVSGIMEGDVVELIAGPFKGEKARVKQIDEAKEEITVELFEAMVPIPVTVRGDHVRVLEKEK